MTVRRWTLSILVAVLVLAVAAAGVLASRQPANSLVPAQQQPTGAYRFVYSVKFVCGYQPPVVDQPGVSRGEPVVKPANYATEINIHNYNFKTSELRKKIVLLVRPSADGKETDIVREPRTTGPVTNAAGTIAFESIKLERDFATLDDCNKFWQWVYPNTAPPVPFPLMIGYLVIYSSLDLDVDAVYTAAAPGPLSRESQSISIDVERVPGKRVFIPTGTVPD